MSLDDPKYIQQFDTQNALEIALDQWQQLEAEFIISPSSQPIENVVFSGMGGSALAAHLSIVWPGYTVPFEIVRDYHLPAYTSKKSLVVISSYSGNTEETLSTLAEAQKLDCQIVIISSGGKLEERAQADSIPYIQLPAGLQPRHAVWYAFRALISLLEAYGLMAAVGEHEKELQSAVGFLKNAQQSWRPSVPFAQNQAKQLADSMLGTTPIIYAGILYPAAYKWKINVNENAKNTAWCGQYPEFNHNEFLGWSAQPVEKPFRVIDLISSFDNPQTKKRFVLSDKLLSGRRPKAMQISAEGETLIQQLLWTVMLGDVVSVYLALLNGLNPTPVDLIEKFKKELAS